MMTWDEKVKEVARRIELGHDRKAIANDLQITKSTVHAYANLARQRGLLPPPKYTAHRDGSVTITPIDKPSSGSLSAAANRARALKTQKVNITDVPLHSSGRPKLDKPLLPQDPNADWSTPRQYAPLQRSFYDAEKGGLYRPPRWEAEEVAVEDANVMKVADPVVPEQVPVEDDSKVLKFERRSAPEPLKFAPGDTVRFKSGGCLMTVAVCIDEIVDELFKQEPGVLVFWMREYGEYESEVFPSVVLEKSK
jgi:hypothetical protein